MISAYWNQLPVRTRGLIASTALAVLLAMLTLVQQQFTVGTIDWHAILRIGVSTLLAGVIQFLHGLRLPQEEGR